MASNSVQFQAIGGVVVAEWEDGFHMALPFLGHGEILDDACMHKDLVDVANEKRAEYAARRAIGELVTAAARQAKISPNPQDPQGGNEVKRSFTVRRHVDGTVTFKSERYIEHIDVRHLGLLETYEALKYAAITAGLSLNEHTLEELFRLARGLDNRP